MTKRLLAIAALACLALALVATPGGAQTTSNTASADAFGVKAVVSPFQQEPIRVGPTPEVHAFEPPAGEAQTDSVADLGPVPDDGALIQHIRGVRVSADGDAAAGSATATAETAAVSLFGGRLKADVLRAVSTTTCPGPGDVATASAGSTVVGLELDGNPVAAPLEPNQAAIRIADDTGQGIADVRLFEVIPDGDGLGWTTRMVHVFTLDPVTQAVNGQIIIAEAHSAVTCGAAAGGAGDDNEVIIEQEVEPSTAAPGEQVTYDITIRNQGTQFCTVYEITDRLPPSFTFDSATGALAEVEGEQGGREVLFSKPDGWPLEAGQELTGTVTATIDADAQPGVYTNVVIARTTCGVFTGVGAPVTVTGASAAGPLAGGPVDAAGPLPETGAQTALLGLALLGAGGAGVSWRRLRRR